MNKADSNALNNVYDFTMTELRPTDSHKSFYGKASIYTKNGYSILRSYGTYVAMICPNGDFIRLWGGWSATTSRHISSFVSTIGFPNFGKRVWDKMVCGNRYKADFVRGNA